MTVLNRAELFSRELPAGSARPSAIIARLDVLTREQKANGTSTPEAQTEARALYDELLHQSAPLRQDDRAPSLGTQEELRARFIEAVLLWMSFCQTSSLPLIDSLDTRSIRAFPIDLPPDDAAFALLKRALVASQGSSEQEIADAQERVARLTPTLPLKRALTQALQARLSAAHAHPARFADLMRECYGELPWHASDVDFVLTATGIFFVLPIDGDRLLVPDWARRAEAEREAIGGFLARLARENLTETWRFPAFGLFDAERLSPELVAELGRQVGASPESVRQALVTMISILPKGEIDQYLVHDAWGHTWQEVLNDFELEYLLLRRVSDPLSPSDGPTFGGSATPPFTRAFQAHAGTTRLDEQRLLGTADADLRGRIHVGSSQVLSEILADFVEAKFSRLASSPLPTSSLLAAHTLKYDLSIQDALRQARRWSRPYRNLWSKPEERARWVRALSAEGLPEPGLGEAVDRAAALLEASYAEVLRPAIAHGSPTPASPSPSSASSVVTRILLELALLCGELERVLDETAQARPTPAWTRPTCCPDLWAVGLSHLYEADRENRLWCLDTLVRTSLREACDALGRELDKPGYGSAPG